MGILCNSPRRNSIVDKHGIDNLCSEYDVFIIRQRCSIELITKIIPNASASIDDENENDKQIQDSLLQVYLEYPISISTTWRWLRRLGFSYDTRKKSFFVDGHERPNVVCRRNEFCLLYLSKLEPKKHRWIHQYETRQLPSSNLSLAHLPS